MAILKLSFIVISLLFASAAADSGIAEARISISPGSIYFGSVEVGSSRYRSIYVRNQGDSEARLRVSDTCGGAMYARTYQCRRTLPPNGSCRMSVEFRPRRKGREYCTIRITADGYGRSVSISGSGRQRHRP